MHHYQKEKKVTVMEAVEALAGAAEAAPSEESVLGAEPMLLNLDVLTWHGSRYAERNRERVRESFGAILEYLKNFYEKEKGSLNDLDIQRGIQAVMLLTAEAAQKMDQYAQYEGEERREESVVHLKEYQELQQFYQTKIAQKARHYGVIKGWQNLWKPLAMGSPSSADIYQLSWHSVCQDTVYELFLIRKGDGTPFFSEGLLRHLCLVGAFDTFFTETSGDDLFTRLIGLQGRDLHETARQVLEGMRNDLEGYFKEALRYKARPLVSALNRAIMALMLAANPGHLENKGEKKSCHHYFSDFQHYLRMALASDEYAQWDKTTPISKLNSSCYSASFFKALVNVLYGITSALFLRRSDISEIFLLMEQLIEEGAKGVYREASLKSPESVWHEVSDQYTQIYGALKRHPSGPLTKAIQVLSALEEGEILWGYDPFIQGNIPSCAYTLELQGRDIECLRMPFPTRQESIERATVIEEFKLFIQGMHGGSQRHLMILLEEEESLLSKGRYEALLQFRNESGYAEEALILLHLPKSGDFYTQSGVYITMDAARSFIDDLCRRALKFSLKDFFEEVQKIANEIHQRFFGGKDLLTRKNRLDFIEIFDNYCILKCLELHKPDSMSFNCKDGLDVGAAASAGFYVFFQRAQDKKQLDLSSWKQRIYAPSLLLRHRLILPAPLDRMLSSLSLD